jgi:hypothetical protein
MSERLAHVRKISKPSSTEGANREEYGTKVSNSRDLEITYTEKLEGGLCCGVLNIM